MLHLSLHSPRNDITLGAKGGTAGTVSNSESVMPMSESIVLRRCPPAAWLRASRWCLGIKSFGMRAMRSAVNHNSNPVLVAILAGTETLEQPESGRGNSEWGALSGCSAHGPCGGLRA